MHQENILFVGGPARQADLLNRALPTGYALHLASEFSPKAIKTARAVLIYLKPAHYRSFETIVAIKKYDPNKPVVVVGEPDVLQNEIAEAFRVGANDFLFLPFEMDTLSSCLYRFVSRPMNPSTTNRWMKWLTEWLFPSKWDPAVSTVSNITPFTMQEPVELATMKAAKADLQVQMLGQLRVMIQGTEIQRLPGKKARSVLAYLLHKYPQPVHRENLIDKFWGDSTTDSARNCLNVTLHAIRKSFEDMVPGVQVIVYKDESYCISPELVVERDIDLFDFYWKKARQVEMELGIEAAVDTYHQAFAFYRGDLLEDLPYEEWVERSRERSKETWLVILDRLSKHFYESGKYQICLGLCKRMLIKDNCLEDTHRRLMGCYLKLGMKDLAVRQFQKCQEALKVELSVVPGKATLDLFNLIQAA